MTPFFYINGCANASCAARCRRRSKITCAIKERRLKGSGECQNRLVERNLRLVVYIAKRFENTGIGIEDLISIGTLGLIKAISTFNTDKNIKLATYASRCIENEILMYIRQKRSYQKRRIARRPIKRGLGRKRAAFVGHFRLRGRRNGTPPGG